MSQCPVRSFFCGTTKLFFGAGVLLLVSGFLFCDINHYWLRAETLEEVKPALAQSLKPHCTHNGDCKLHSDSSADKSSINTQQREIKRRLSRIGTKIEKLKEQRKRTKDARTRRDSK